MFWATRKKSLIKESIGFISKFCLNFVYFLENKIRTPCEIISLHKIFKLNLCGKVEINGNSTIPSLKSFKILFKKIQLRVFGCELPLHFNEKMERFKEVQTTNMFENFLDSCNIWRRNMHIFSMCVIAIRILRYWAIAINTNSSGLYSRNFWKFQIIRKFVELVQPIPFIAQQKIIIQKYLPKASLSKHFDSFL